MYTCSCVTPFGLMDQLADCLGTRALCYQSVPRHHPSQLPAVSITTSLGKDDTSPMHLQFLKFPVVLVCKIAQFC